MSEAVSDGERTELGDLSDLEDGQMRSFESVGEYGVVVCRVEGTLYCLEDNCSHADTPLSEGRLRGTMITCPLHGAAFDVRDGSHSGPPAWEGVRTYEVSESDGGVVIDLASDAGGDDAPPPGGPLQMR